MVSLPLMMRGEQSWTVYPEAALERVPWVPLNPLIFQISKKNTYGLVKRSKKSLNQRLLSRCEPVD